MEKSTLMQRFGALGLRVIGWRLVMVPPPKKCVAIFYPHTSNWDFVIGMFARWAGNLKAYWAGKDTIFKWPVAGLLKRLGGIPVNRRIRTGFTGQMVEEFARRDELLLVIAPEGTRRHTDYLKSGFYHLTLAAKVPLGLCFIDYYKREIGIGGYIELSGNVEPDLDAIRAFYADKHGRHPEKMGALKFREGDSRPG